MLYLSAGLKSDRLLGASFVARMQFGSRFSGR